MRAIDRRRRLAPVVIVKSIRPFSNGTILLVLSAAAAAILAGTIFFYIGLGSPWLVVLAVVILLVLLGMICSNQKKSEILETHDSWVKKELIFGLLVTSDSPKWKDHIGDLWVSRFGSAIKVLNWSERHCWPKSVEAQIFEIATGRIEYCPVFIVFREHGLLEVFRFYRAFKAAKHGYPGPLVKMESLMFREFENWQSARLQVGHRK